MDDGSDQGNEWTKKIFDDSQWNEGPVGYGGDGEATKLSYGPNRNDKVRTYYFRHKLTLMSCPKPFRCCRHGKGRWCKVYLNGKKLLEITC